MAEPSSASVKELFMQAADLDSQRRSAFLDEACAGDVDLRAAVEELFHFDAEAQSAPDFLRSPAADIRAALPTAEGSVPASIGRYRVVRRLGEGGMGTVYEAEQDEPRRTVALKVMRLGLDSPEFRRRFSREASILGRLHHPGIAQVYDAGATEDGRLYFAMEFIRGLRLDEHVRRHVPEAGDRLELLARVCDAVQHAHEQGVIHRDLKPANILVDETGQPKVLDFGVAHATGAASLGSQRQHPHRPAHRHARLHEPRTGGGRPAVRIDARSDVYTLGVILFELLAGRLPYRLDDLPVPEMVRVIREEEPSRLGSVNRRFRGEVETIVAKALEKDRARRYPSAGELGEDLRRYLAHEPIRARPASALYQVQKFVRRHKGLVAGGAIVFAALLAATVISLLSARDARQSARLARSQAYRARLAAAAAALSGEDVADADRNLEDAPEELRGWEWRHLHSRLDDSSVVVRLRPGDPALLLPGPEGLRVGVFTDTGLRFVDENGNESPERPFPSPSDQSFSVAAVADRLWLAAEVPLVTLRDETGRTLRRFNLPKKDTFALALSPDRTRVAIAVSSDEARRYIGIYDTTSGEERVRCDNHPEYINGLTFSPDGTRLASGSDGDLVSLWDAATGRQLAECRGHTSKVFSLSFRADGSRLLSVSHDGTVRQWDVPSGREVEPPYDRHTAEVLAAVYSPDGQRVASAGADHTVRLWWATGRRDQAVLRGHSGVVSALAFSHDGRRLVSASYDSPISPGDGTARFWEAAPEATLPVLAGHTSYVYPVAYSPDGQWIASGAWDHTIRLWDAATGEPCAALPHPGVVAALAFGPDGTWLISGGFFADGLLIWDVATGRVRSRIQAVGNSVRSLAVSRRWDQGRGRELRPGRRRNDERRGPRDGPGGRCRERITIRHQPRREAAGRQGSRREEYRPLGRADLPARRPLARTRGSNQRDRLRPRGPPSRLGEQRPHGTPLGHRDGPMRARLRGPYRRGVRGGVPPRRHAPRLGRPRPRRLAVGLADWPGGGASDRTYELRLVAGLQPRRQDAGFRFGRFQRATVGHRARPHAPSGAVRGRRLIPCGGAFGRAVVPGEKGCHGSGGGRASGSVPERAPEARGLTRRAATVGRSIDQVMKTDRPSPTAPAALSGATAC